jgi:hypothetical protein
MWVLLQSPKAYKIWLHWIYVSSAVTQSTTNYRTTAKSVSNTVCQTPQFISDNLHRVWLLCIETVLNSRFCSGVNASDVWPFRWNAAVIIIGQTDRYSVSSSNCVQWLFVQFRMGNNYHLTTFVTVVTLHAQLANIPLDVCENTTASQIAYHLEIHKRAYIPNSYISNSS